MKSQIWILTIFIFSFFATELHAQTTDKLEDTQIWQEMDQERKYQYDSQTVIRDILDPAEEPTDYERIITNKETDPRTPIQVFFPRKQTPSRLYTANLSMPIYFETSNNLTQKKGNFYHAFGDLIFIEGTVKTQFGVPIDGAIVEIWQTNAAGKYHTLLDSDSEYIDPYFSMSGRTVTNNLGEYSFATIMPGAYPGRAPHINMNVYHKKFGKLETEIYFENHALNKMDYQYLSYSPEDREFLTAKVRHSNIFDPKSKKICLFDVVMTGTYQYKSLGGPYK